MIQGLCSIVIVLLAGLACPAQVLTQPKAEDSVRRAVEKYQSKVDQLEQLTKRILADRKQQLEEAAAVQTRLERENAQLNDQLAQLKEQLANANAERNRMQRALKEREAEKRVRKEPAAKTAPGLDRLDRLDRLEDQAAKMERWLGQLRQDVEELLRRPAVKASRSPDIHIHNRGGSVILHFHGGKPGKVQIHKDDERDDLVGKGR